MTASPKMRAQNPPKSYKELKNEELLRCMKEECVPVKGIFKNYECEGATLALTQRKYPYHPELNRNPIFKEVLQDGAEHEIPLWVARWLNGKDITAKELNGKLGSCSYPKYAYDIPEGTATPVVIPGRRKQRFGFQSLEFTA